MILAVMVPSTMTSNQVNPVLIFPNDTCSFYICLEAREEWAKSFYIKVNESTSEQWQKHKTDHWAVSRQEN